MVLNTKKFTTPFEEFFAQELNKCLQKFFFVDQKTLQPFGHLLAKIVIDGNSK